MGLTRVQSADVPVTSENAFQVVDLPVTLNPTGFQSRNAAIEKCLSNGVSNSADCHRAAPRRKGSGPNLLGVSPDRSSGADMGDDVERLRLETALDAFYNDPKTAAEDIKLRRTRVQQRLISAADMNCGIFTQRIYTIQASLNAGFGSMATALGGFGAIVTQVDRARFLSGASSIMSGIRGELNEDFFRRLWVEALVKAIETERGELRREMATHARDEIGDYPVEQAIADAIRYNDACSLVSGLRKVNDAVVIADEVAGLRVFRSEFAKFGFNPEFVPGADPENPGRSDRLVPRVVPAGASVGLRDIDDGVARVALLASNDAALIDNLPELLDEEKTAAKSKIEAAVSELGKGSEDSPTELQRYRNELAAYQTSYATLASELDPGLDPVERAKKLDAMKHIDSAADNIRRSALQLVDRVKQRVMTCMMDAQALSKRKVEAKALAAKEEKDGAS